MSGKRLRGGFRNQAVSHQTISNGRSGPPLRHHELGCPMLRDVRSVSTTSPEEHNGAIYSVPALHSPVLRLLICVILVTPPTVLVTVVSKLSPPWNLVSW